MELAESLRRQAALIHEWLRSPEALQAANTLVKRLQLPCDGDDLVQQAWLRVSTSFAARTEPLADMGDLRDAARYGYRMLSNIGLDRLRSAARDEALVRHETLRVDAPDEPDRRTMALSFFEELLRRITVTDLKAGNCGGCSPDVIRSISISVVQSFALETLAAPLVDGRARFELLVDQAIQSFDAPSDSARVRKRRSRCKECVRELMARVLGEMEDHHG